MVGGGEKRLLNDTLDITVGFTSREGGGRKVRQKCQDTTNKIDGMSKKQTKKKVLLVSQGFYYSYRNITLIATTFCSPCFKDAS